MYNTNKCPKCKKFIFGKQCFDCNILDITKIENGIDMPEFFKDIFGGEKNGK